MMTRKEFGLGLAAAAALSARAGKGILEADGIVRISEIEVFPEHLDAYLKAAAKVGAESVQKEPGVICIFPMRQKRNVCQIRILEIYASHAAYRSHIASAHFQTYKQGTLHMVKSLDLVDMDPLDPEGMPRCFVKLAGSV